MKTGYYSNFLHSKALKAGVTTVQVKRTVKKPQPIHADLSDIQTSAYNWMVDSGLIRVLDNVNRDTLVEALTAAKFQSLFKIGRYFGVAVSQPRSDELSLVTNAITFLIRGLQEKGVIPLTVSIEKIVRKDRNHVLDLLVLMYQCAIKGPRATSLAKLAELSNWLLSLGLSPSPNEDWFSGHSSLLEDKGRNGELLCSLCSVLRPVMFDEPVPPAKSPREMAERNRQALAILCEEGVIERSDVQRAEDIVRGTTDALEIIVGKVKREYDKRQEQMMNQIAIFDDC